MREERPQNIRSDNLTLCCFWSHNEKNERPEKNVFFRAFHFSYDTSKKPKCQFFCHRKRLIVPENSQTESLKTKSFSKNDQR